MQTINPWHKAIFSAGNDAARLVHDRGILAADDTDSVSKEVLEGGDDALPAKIFTNQDN